MKQTNLPPTDKYIELLRFTTAGSVDDGKSTLIGRLLYDSKSIFQDQYDAIEEVSKRRGEEGVNFALLTDGLKAERDRQVKLARFQEQEKILHNILPSQIADRMIEGEKTPFPRPHTFAAPVRVMFLPNTA